MHHLTFEPLRRNRYRVHGTGKDKAPIVKKAQIGNFTRSFYGNLRRATRNSPPALTEVKIFGGYADCPRCDTSVYTSPRTVTCRNCGRDFIAIGRRIG